MHRRVYGIVICAALTIFASGCVNQHPDMEHGGSEVGEYSGEALNAGKGEKGNKYPDLKSGGGMEPAVEAAREKVVSLGREPRIIATSAAVAEICAELGLDLVGVPDTVVSKIPEIYDGVERTGTAMSPDMEKIALLSPDWILAPVSLKGDLQPKFEAAGSEWAFLNLNNVNGMYKSIEELGIIFGREAEAERLTDDFKSFMAEYESRNEGRKAPKVLILMGLPGSYVIATENSYIGSLVEMAGGENVYSGTAKQFLNVNTEDIKNKEPDIILRAAHAIPDKVMEMFDKDFRENDIWQHFEAVQSGRVYNLSFELFGMSARLSYKEALRELEPMLFPQSGEDMKRAGDKSDAAADMAEKSDGSTVYEKLQKNR